MKHTGFVTIVLASIYIFIYVGCGDAESDDSVAVSDQPSPTEEQPTEEQPAAEVKDEPEVEAIVVPETWETILADHELLPAEVNGVSLNAAGFALYEKSLYREASIVFRESTKLDADYRYSFYNLASTLAIMHGQGEDVDLLELFRALNRSIMIEPSERLEKALSDSDFDSVRDLVGFIRIVDSHRLAGEYGDIGAYRYDFFPDGRLLYVLIFEYAELGEGSWHLKPDITDSGRGIIELDGAYAVESAKDGSISNRRYPFASYDLNNMTITLFSDEERREKIRELHRSGSYLNPIGQYEFPDSPIDAFQRHYLYDDVISLRRLTGI